MAKLNLKEYFTEHSFKPALLTSKLFLKCKTNKQSANRLLSELEYWSLLLAELDSIDDITFKMVNELAINLKFHTKSNIIYTAFMLYTLRTTIDLDTSLCTQYLRLIVDPYFTVAHEHYKQHRKLVETERQQDICKGFCYAVLDKHMEMYSALVRAFEDEFINWTKSILLSFPCNKIVYLKEKLIAGRISGTIRCTCNSGVRNFAFSSSLKNLVRIYSNSNVFLDSTTTTKEEQTDQRNLFRVCSFHRILSELDDICRILKKKEMDITPILLVHKSVERIELIQELVDRYPNLVDKCFIERLKSTKTINTAVVSDMVF